MIITLHTQTITFTRTLTHTFTHELWTPFYNHAFTWGADVRLCIRHFILWEDGSPSPVVLPIPSASKTQMQQVKDKCQKINDKTVNVKTRFQNECQNCHSSTIVIVVNIQQTRFSIWRKPKFYSNFSLSKSTQFSCLWPLGTFSIWYWEIYVTI